MENTLYFGDNLPLLREYIKDESIDLIYLDPPFNSKANYNVIFKSPDNKEAASQITAFEDTWHWHTGETEYEFNQLVKGGGVIAEVMKGLELVVGKNDLLAYLTMMAIRLREMHRVLKDTGSLYLHCDPTASHYLKIILDAIFGAKNFRNEIIWKRMSSHGNVYKKYGQIHDVLLFYVKTDNTTWNNPKMAHDPTYIKKFFNKIDPIKNRRYRVQNLCNPAKVRPNLTYEWNGVTRVWKYTKEKMKQLDDENRIYYPPKGKIACLKQYLDEMDGQAVQDIWLGIQPLSHAGKERMGYPTQKPVALLERIIKASSNEGDIILDPFCGCGTAIVAAQKLNRKWIGMDVTHLAVGLMEQRIKEEFGIKPKVIGNPASFSSAVNLFNRNPIDFERWAVTRIDGIHPTKASGDKGIDGKGYLGEKGEWKTVVSVKGGKTINPAMVRELIGTVKAEESTFGILITNTKPSKGMLDDARAEGDVDIGVHQFPKIQIWTICDFFNGVMPKLP